MAADSLPGTGFSWLTVVQGVWWAGQAARSVARAAGDAAAAAGSAAAAGASSAASAATAWIHSAGSGVGGWLTNVIRPHMPTHVPCADVVQRLRSVEHCARSNIKAQFNVALCDYCLPAAARRAETWQFRMIAPGQPDTHDALWWGGCIR